MKKSNNSVFKAALAFGLALATTSFAQEVDACKEAGGHAGNGKTTQGQNNSSVTGNIGSTGYHYEIWYQGGNNSMTYYDDGTFKASWSGTNDFLARVGFKYNETQTHQEIGKLSADFKFSKQGTAGGYSYIGIYGWTVDPLVEYYIVDSWFNKPGAYLGQKKGEFTVDGDTYEIYQNTRNQQPSIKGTSTFPQYFSVRSSERSCGHIDLTAHFEKWESIGMKMGKMYEAKFLVEAGGGSGSFDMTYFQMTQEDAVPPKDIPRQPFKGVKSKIPGTVEAEDFDEGNNKVSYGGATGDGGSDRTDYRGEDSDIYKVAVLKSGSEYAIGYTTSGQWMEYTVDVAKDGEYDVAVAASNGNRDGSFTISVDGKEGAKVNFSKTADWDDYQEATGKITLTAGEHVIRIMINDSDTNLDYVKFDLPGYTPETPASSTSAPASSASNPASSASNPASSTTAPASSASNPASSASIDPASSAAIGSSGSDAIHVVSMNRAARNSIYQVFDMQGKFLGKVEVMPGSTLTQALMTKFSKAGLYMVRKGVRSKIVSVTR